MLHIDEDSYLCMFQLTVLVYWPTTVVLCFTLAALIALFSTTVNSYTQQKRSDKATKHYPFSTKRQTFHSGVGVDQNRAKSNK